MSKKKRAPKDAPLDDELAPTACLEAQRNRNTAADPTEAKRSPSALGASCTRRPQPPTKLERILTLLVCRSLNRFEAEKEHDHCLHSTVAQIQTSGVLVERVWEAVPGHLNSKVHVVRYWIGPEQLEAANRLLMRLRGRRR